MHRAMQAPEVRAEGTSRLMHTHLCDFVFGFSELTCIKSISKRKSEYTRIKAIFKKKSGKPYKTQSYSVPSIDRHEASWIVNILRLDITNHGRKFWPMLC